MKQFIDNLISRLEKEPTYNVATGEDYIILENALPKSRVIEIVNQLAEGYKPRTNANKVRQMSDEELAKFCSRACPIDKTCIYWNVETDCEKCALIWLKSEVKDGE